MLPKIYIFKISNVNLKQINLLPKSYLKKISVYKNKSIWLEAIASRLLLRYALIQNGAPHNILNKITYGSTGKPLAIGFFFNISHSNKYVVCAVHNKPIGIDIEKIDIRFQKNKQYFLSNDELKRNKSIATITKLWTQKEAFIKLKGKAISTKMYKLKINHGKTISRKWHNYYISIATLNKLNKFPIIQLVKKI